MKVHRAICSVGEDPPTGLQFWCPACDGAHSIRINPQNGWTWNGDFERPTIGAGADHPGKPSIKVERTKFSELGEQQYAHWQKTGERPTGGKFDSVEVCCHSVVTDGVIRFCGDCTHALMGQTVPLPDWPLGSDESKEARGD